MEPIREFFNSQRKALKRIKNYSVVAIDAINQYRHVDNAQSDFYSLTPSFKETENIAKYEQELLAALDEKRNPTTRNIAITGAYGAGKSTFLQSFKRRHSEFRYVPISLATFANEDSYENPQVKNQEGEPQSNNGAQNDNSNEGGDLKEKQKDVLKDVEASIVQQLLYRVKNNKLPNTRFKRIRHISLFSKLLFMVMIIFSALAVYDVWPTPAPASTTLKFVSDFVRQTPDILSLAWLFFVGSLLLFWITNFLLKINIDGFGIKNGKLQTIHESSVLNQNLDEVLYFFESTSFNVVIIEDLDRFNAIEIFTKLREINLILNQSDHVKQTVYFIYAVKDEIFSASDRTKFFDIIIPIVPIVHSENAFELLNKGLRKLNHEGDPVLDQIDSTFLREVSYYIDDMRILYNIINEFDVYLNKLATKVDMNFTKLLAMIVFKNLLPSEQAKLVKNEGLVYEVFKSLSKTKLEKIKGIEQRIESQKDILKSKRKETAQTIVDIRAIYWGRLAQMVRKEGALHTININGASRVNFDAFIGDDSLPLLLSGKRFTLENERQQQLFVGNLQTMKDIEADMPLSYENRRNLLEQDVDSVHDQIELLQKEIKEIQHSTLSAATDYINEDDLFPKELLTVKKLYSLKYLLRNGHIAEDYTEYLSQFHPGSLSYSDKSFLLTFREGGKFEYSQEIQNPEEVLARLKPSDFETAGLLINDLIECLCRDLNAQYGEFGADQFLVILFTYFKNEPAKFYEFYSQYEMSKNVGSIFRAIGAHEPVLVRQLFIHGLEEGVEQDKLAEKVLLSMTKEQLILLSGDSDIEVTSFINELPDVSRLFVDWEKQESIWQKLILMKVRFLRLDVELSSDAMFRQVAEDRLFAINPHMLESIIWALSDTMLVRPRTISFHLLTNSSSKPLTEVVNQNINSVIDDVLLRYDSLNESEKSLLDLLNNLSLTESQKVEIMKRVYLRLDAIEDINDKKLWGAAIEQKLIDCSWHNVLTYFFELCFTVDENEDLNSEIDGPMSAFISDLAVAEALVKEPVPDEFVDRFEIFNSEIIESDSIEETAIKIFVENNVLDVTPIDVNLLADARVKTLIDINAVPFNTQNIEKIQKSFVECLLPFLKNNIEQFVKFELDDIGMSSDIYTNLLKEDISFYAKIKICQAQSSTDYSYDEELAEQAMNLFSESIDNILKFDVKLGFDPINSILEHGFDIKRKVKLLATQVKFLSWREISSLLVTIDSSVYSDLINKKRVVKLSESSANELLLEQLKANGFVGEHQTKGQKLVAYSKPSAMSD